MSSEQPVQLDVVIFGGGVAGLWLLARLRRLGYQAVLLERAALGAGQTRHAQGIIHGGTKYALTGKLTGSSEAIAEMPAIWRAALAGDGELDLRQVRLMTDHQFMWSTESLTSRLAGFFASKVMKSRTASVEGAARPQVLQHPSFRGQVYRLDEPVIDVASLIRGLAEPERYAIFALTSVPLIEHSSDRWRVTVSDGERNLILQARRLVFAAGGGNAALLTRIGHDTPAMQLRPLQMVMVRGSEQNPLPGVIYAHCLGASANPRITITTHYDSAGRTVWYLGGQIAEEGVGRDRASQIAAARQELHDLLPWLELGDAEWGVLPIDRAEVKMGEGQRPDSSYCGEDDGVITAWPTKLAFAPRLAHQVVELLVRGGIQPGPAANLPEWAHPGYAPLPWQEEEKWS